MYQFSLGGGCGIIFLLLLQILPLKSVVSAVIKQCMFIYQFIFTHILFSQNFYTLFFYTVNKMFTYFQIESRALNLTKCCCVSSQFRILLRVSIHLNTVMVLILLSQFCFILSLPKLTMFIKYFCIQLQHVYYLNYSTIVVCIVASQMFRCFVHCFTGSEREAGGIFRR